MGSSGFEGWTEERVRQHNERVRNASGAARPVVRVTPTVEPPVPLPPSHFSVAPSTDEEKLNKTERAYLAELRAHNYPYLGIQNITIKIGEDCRFTPDFNYIDHAGHFWFVDTKGGFQWEDSLIKIKTAARMYRWAKFVIAKKKSAKEGGGWDVRIVKP